MHPTSTSANQAAPAGGEPWLNALLGLEDAGRKALLRWGLHAQVYVFGLALLFVAVYKGLADWRMASGLTAYSLLGLSVFYVLFRSGWSARCKDPYLTYPLALFSASAIALSYGLSDISREVTLELIIVLVVFEMYRLNQRQTMVIAFGSVAILTGILVWFSLNRSEGLDLLTEWSNLAMAGILVPVLNLIAADFRRLRRKQSQQRVEMSETLARVHDLAMRDALTGLYNRRQILALMQEWSARLARGGAGFCVAIVDIDHFKRINDEFGHGVGDAVLRDFAEAARRTLRSVDVMGRWGGEEFIVLLHDIDVDGASAALQRMREAVSCHQWSALADRAGVTFSAGAVAYCAGDDGRVALDLADKALYQAKNEGRDRVVTWKEPSP